MTPHFSTFTDIVMNIVGIFMWLAVGATALHYWHGYQSEHRYIHVSSERQVKFRRVSVEPSSDPVYF